MTLGRLVDKKTPSYDPEDKVYVKGKFHKKGDIVSALKLQELVKEKIRECKANAGGMVYGMALESLVVDSEKTVKERGSGGKK